MKMLLALVAAAVSLAGCGVPSDVGPAPEPSPEPAACTTPADAQAPADLTITARDAVIELRPGVSFTAWTYDGDVPGPVIRMALGETKRVKLVNESPRAASLHFHGVSYAERDDGSPEQPESMVNPGCAHVYTITADQPGVWAYHSHRDPRVEMAQGLHGAVVVPFPDEAPADHEYVVFLGQLGMEEEGEEEEEAEEEEEGGESGFAMTINGRPDGRAKVIGLEGDRYRVTDAAEAAATVGQRVRWRVINVSPDEPHTFHLHGHTWCDRGGVIDEAGICPGGTLPTDNVDILSAQGFSFEYLERNPGNWMYHCHIVDHVYDGMFAFYDVSP